MLGVNGHLAELHAGRLDDSHHIIRYVDELRRGRRLVFQSLADDPRCRGIGPRDGLPPGLHDLFHYTPSLVTRAPV